MRILAIDQSFRSAGITVQDQDDGLLYFDIIVTDKAQDTPDRINTIYTGCQKLCEKFGIRTIVMEDLAYNAIGSATRELAGLYHVLRYKFQIDDLYDVVSYPPTSVKKHATGSGRALKSDVIKALPYDVYIDIAKKFGKKMDDLADSYFLGQLYFANKKKGEDIIGCSRKNFRAKKSPHCAGLSSVKLDRP